MTQDWKEKIYHLEAEGLVNLIESLLKEERNAVLSEVIDLIPNTYHEIAGNKLIAKIESLKHE